MNRKLLIIGASGHGKVVADIALKMNQWVTVSFLDDNESLKSSMGLEVKGKSTDFHRYINEYDIFVAIGNNLFREKLHEMLESFGASIPLLVHPNANIGTEVIMGAGTVVMAGVVINSSTIIGKGCIINTGSTIDHDNQIGDYVHISPGVNLAGTVSIGSGTWIGIGSNVINNVKITSSSICGAGSVVIKDISEAGTYIGVPVRRIK